MIIIQQYGIKKSANSNISFLRNKYINSKYNSIIQKELMGEFAYFGTYLKVDEEKDQVCLYDDEQAILIKLSNGLIKNIII